MAPPSRTSSFSKYREAVSSRSSPRFAARRTNLYRPRTWGGIPGFRTLLRSPTWNHSCSCHQDHPAILQFHILMNGDRMSLSQFTTSTPHVEYVLGHSSRELDRLSFQGTVLAPFSRHLFNQAGIVPGMRVLDVGSGSGDVSFLAAELVGESGHVLGVDRSAPAVERARARAIRRN